MMPFRRIDDEIAVSGGVPEIGSLQAGAGSTGAVGPVTPGALRIEDPLSGGQLTGIGAGERPRLRIQHLCDNQQ